jgi:hypothetical protein
MVFDAYKAAGDSVMAGVIEKAKVGADIQMTQYPGQDRRIVHGLEAGMVISRVESLPMEQRCLVRFCFGPFTARELDGDRETIEGALFVRLAGSDLRIPGQAAGEKPTKRQLEQLSVLCDAALYHHAQVTWPYKRKGLSTPQAVRDWAEQVKGVTLEGRWTYGNRPAWRWLWERCLSLLDYWESSGLAPLGELLAETHSTRRNEKTPA